MIRHFLVNKYLRTTDRPRNLQALTVTTRHRESPYEIVSLERAISSILHQIHPLPSTLEKVTHSAFNKPA